MEYNRSSMPVEKRINKVLGRIPISNYNRLCVLNNNCREIQMAKLNSYQRARRSEQLDCADFDKRARTNARLDQEADLCACGFVFKPTTIGGRQCCSKCRRPNLTGAELDRMRMTDDDWASEVYYRHHPENRPNRLAIDWETF